MNKQRVQEQIKDIEDLLHVGDCHIDMMNEESQLRLLKCIRNHIEIIKAEIEEA